MRGTWDDVGSAAMYSSAVGPVVLSAALNGWRRWWRRRVDSCMGNETPAFSATYRGATLDVMVAFSDRPIVFRYQEKRNCFQLVYSTTVTIHPPSMYTLAPQCNDSINLTELGWLRVCPPDVWYRGSLGWLRARRLTVVVSGVVENCSRGV